jgi:lipoprotein-anchoring transpeptidase ErfK/SrfK
LPRRARVRLTTLSATAVVALSASACAGGGPARSMPAVIGSDATVARATSTASAAPSTPAPTAASASTSAGAVTSGAVTGQSIPLSATPRESATGAASEVLAPIPVIDGGPKGLSTGSKGPAVASLEARLAALRFNAGKTDGVYDSPLFQAVMAFQKQQGLPRTGKADAQTLAAVSTASVGAPMVATGEPTRVEVDLKRQMAQFWQDGKLVRVIPVSSGNGAHYCVPKDKGGGCDVAVTPGGSYRADRKIQGDRESKLGHLYDPVYFNGGIAIHGSGSVPAGPASHGCIRVPMWESRWVYDNVAIGEPVYVVGGEVAPVPFGETAPTEGADVTAPTDPAAH